MNFGKHKGRPLREIDLGYLHWVVANSSAASDTLRTAIREEIARRMAPSAESIHPGPWGGKRPGPWNTTGLILARRQAVRDLTDALARAGIHGGGRVALLAAGRLGQAARLLERVLEELVA
jgi:hypothetical protein